MHSQRFLPASCWEYAAKHMVKILRYVPTSRTKPETPSRLMGAGDARRDVGIYLGDAEDTKRGCLLYM